MTTCHNVPLIAVGIVGLRFITPPPLDAYEMGRVARISNIPRESCPFHVIQIAEDWQRGWDIVDYALNHP